MRHVWFLALISLAIAGLVCSLPSLGNSPGVLREGIDQGTTTRSNDAGAGTNPGETPLSKAVAPATSQPPTGTPDQNKAAIKALQTQINNLAQLAQMVADHGRLLKANSTALVGKHGDGGMQKTVNECQKHCDAQSQGDGGGGGDNDT